MFSLVLLNHSYPNVQVSNPRTVLTDDADHRCLCFSITVMRTTGVSHYIDGSRCLEIDFLSHTNKLSF